MRRRMAVISALIIGVSCCSPGMSAEASQNGKDSVKTEDQLKENTFEKNYLLGKDQALGMNGIDEINPEDSHNLLDIGQENALERDVDWFDFGNLDSIKTDLNSLKEDEDHSDYMPPENKEKIFVADEINKDGKEFTKDKEDRAEKNRDIEMSGMKDLQVPQKLDVVIDPWEMDKKGQIYSEEYTIKNTGEMTGVLTLSRLTCKPKEKSSAVVRIDREVLHENGEKSVYMEMIFGNDGKVILSEAGAEYQAKLEPGGELSFRFAGEVNEYAEDQWTNEDIKVDVVYSWDVEAAADDIDGRNIDEVNADKADVNTDNEDANIDKNTLGNTEGLDEDAREYMNSINKDSAVEDADNVKEDNTENAGNKDDMNGAENAELDVDDTEKKKTDDTGKENNADDDSQVAVDLEGEESDDGENLPKIEKFSCERSDDENQDEKIKIIDLQKMEKSMLMIDSWTEDKEVQDEENLRNDQNKQDDQRLRVISSEYVLRNTGETTGTLILNGLGCKAREKSGITIIENQEELYNSTGEAVCIEMVTRDGEDEKKKTISQEGSEYQVEIEPGEEISIRFVGEMKEGLAEFWKEGNVEVKAVCLWRL